MTLMAMDATVGRGAYLFGPVDAGKTRCMWELAKHLVRTGTRVEFLTETQLSHQVARRGRDGSLWDWIDSLCTVPMLFLDDIGKAPHTDRFISELWHITNERMNWQRPMFISGQLSGAELAERSFGRDAASRSAMTSLVRRIRTACPTIEFTENPTCQPPSAPSYNQASLPLPPPRSRRSHPPAQP
jgi:DNA replication protein DnaC